MELALSLRRSDRRRIEKLAHRTPEALVLIRCRIILKVAAGCSQRRAARKLGCVPPTAWQIVQRNVRRSPSGSLWMLAKTMARRRGADGGSGATGRAATS